MCRKTEEGGLAAHTWLAPGPWKSWPQRIALGGWTLPSQQEGPVSSRQKVPAPPCEKNSAIKRWGRGRKQIVMNSENPDTTTQNKSNSQKGEREHKIGS